MYRLETHNTPRSKIVRENDPDTKCVRVYQRSPEEIALQIWAGKRYMIVSLSAAEARAIAEVLVTLADEQLTPFSSEDLLALVNKEDV